MFKLRDMQLPQEYTSTDLANALTRVTVYTYGDTFEIDGADVVTKPSQGEAMTGSCILKDIVICQKPDATMLVTEYSTGFMGVIPYSNDEASFVTANPDVMADIATLLGYSGYVVYQFSPLAENDRCRMTWRTQTYDWSDVTTTSYAAVEVPYKIARLASDGPNSYRGFYVAPNAAKALFASVPIPDMATQPVANGVLLWQSYEIRVPLEYYFTDMQNVQDAARQSVALADAAIQDQINTITLALGNVASLVGALSVFGNSVKDVTDRYNSVTQYIPRP